jgi:hypothetical protein
MSAAPKAIPTMGPTTTPEIQVLLFNEEIGVDICCVGCGVLELKEATVPEVVAPLEVATVVAILDDVGTADVAPMNTFSTKIVGYDSLGSYYSTGPQLYWILSQGH